MKKSLLAVFMLASTVGIFAQQTLKAGLQPKRTASATQQVRFDAKNSRLDVSRLSAAPVASVQANQLAARNAVRPPMKAPADGVYYQRPEGTFYNDFNAVFPYIPALVPVTFKNMSTVDKTQSEWSFIYNGEADILTDYQTEENDLNFTFPTITTGYFSSYYIPHLTIGGVSFQFGEGQSSYIGLMNGDSIAPLTQVNGVAGTYTGFSDGYVFGTGDRTLSIDGASVNAYRKAIYEFFPKPIKPLYIENISFMAISTESEVFLPEGTSMTMYVCPVVDNSIGKPIATMPFTIDDAESVTEITNSTTYHLRAEFVVAQKEKDAFGTQYDVPFIVDQPFVVIIDGFNQPGVNFSLYMTDVEATYTDSWAEGGFVEPTCCTYVNADTGEEIDGLWYCQYISSGDYKRQYNAYMTINGMCDVVNVIDGFETMYADAEGGSIYAVFEEPNDETGETEQVAYGTVQYETLLPRLSTWEGYEGEDNYTFEGLPDWLTVEGFNDDYFEKYNTTLATIVAAPLPEGVKSRKAEIRIVSERGGDSGVITVIQGDENENPEPQPMEITEGKYFLVNMAAEKAWGAGNNWGTQASLVKHAEYVILHPQEDGTFFMETQVSNGGESYYFGGEYMDGSPVALTITPVEFLGYLDDAETKTSFSYTIANGENYYGWNGENTILGQNLAADSENALWVIISEEDARANMITATADDPLDVTYLILDPNFGRNNRNQSAWNVSADCTNYKLSDGNYNNWSNNCAESYHSTFTISQTIANVPNGIYSLTAQGFYRQDGTDNDNLPVFFINGESKVVPLKTGAENSMAEAAASFSNGLYTIEPIYVEVKDGNIELGVRLENNTNIWCIWDNFELTYYGTDADINELQNAALIAKLNELREQATNLQGQVENDNVKAALADALASTANVTASSAPADVQAAINTLTQAISLAEGNIIAKDVLPAMKAFTETTNVYTEQAFNDYYTQWNDKFVAGTLTKDEALALQNPDVVTGWHANITVDDLLLSAWDAEAGAWTPYYINTWSVEGDNDGSNFRVPFFEYWTGDDQSLGERTLTATMTGLQEGEYEVSAWTRVRAKNGYEAPAYGITLQVNDGNPVNVAAGEQVGDSQFFLNTFSALGNVADGTLNIKFQVAADNNISWLSFKNVMFQRKGELNGINTVNAADAQSFRFYNLNGQQVEQPQKGLYIQNGRKVVVK